MITMNRVDKRSDLMSKLQQELERRTKVEEEAIRLIGECEFEKAMVLLNDLDNEVIRQIQEELDALKVEMPEEESDQGKQKEADLLIEDMLIEKGQKNDSNGRDRLQKYANTITDNQTI